MSTTQKTSLDLKSGAAIDLAGLRRVHVLVVGDVMLDRYWFGEVERISPEAPVPVVRIATTEERLGGAANVARNVTALGARAGLLSVVGNDEPGRAVAGLLRQSQVSDHLHVDATLATTVKLRVIGRRQQIARIDFESAPVAEVLAAHFQQFQSLLDLHDLCRLGVAARLRKRRPDPYRQDDRGGAGREPSGHRRSEGRRLLALRRRHPDHAEPGGVARGGGPLARRSRPGTARAETARGPRTASRAADAQRRGHEPFYR